jgi:hypothetical protein
MTRRKANLDGGKQNYNKIDLENVDSWLPEDVQRSLAKIIAARGRRRLGEASGVDEPSTGSEAFLPEWEDMPQSGKQYQLMKRLGLLEVGGVDSLTGVEGDEDGKSDGEGAPYYY